MEFCYFCTISTSSKELKVNNYKGKAARISPCNMTKYASKLKSKVRIIKPAFDQYSPTPLKAIQLPHSKQWTRLRWQHCDQSQDMLAEIGCETKILESMWHARHCQVEPKTRREWKNHDVMTENRGPRGHPNALPNAELNDGHAALSKIDISYL